jgi:eukaryotic-like serine/threonine-protein kinase
MSMFGKTLAHYEITGQLGKGGMGEVYQAKDLKLGRDVAIKVLPEEFAKDADRVSRFRREAKLLASLNHTNIAAIYGLEESEGTNFLVLELVEGETLADQIKRGPIPVEESLKLALQITEALEAAHEKGVIHRDLKPANIKVTPEGKVKVLDFGLAKAYAGGRADLNFSTSPTMSNAATLQGIILGTAAYMSPEQAKGLETDKRSDVWGFGCVLYEMLTGSQAFAGEDVSDTMAAVLRADPDWSALSHGTPTPLQRLLRLCLQKDRKKRIPDMAIARFELDEMLRQPQEMTPAPVGKTTATWRFFAAGFSFLIVACIATGAAVYFLLRPAAPQVTRFDIAPMAPAAFTTMINGVNVALSPDGRRVVYHVRRGNAVRLELKRFDQSAAREVSSSESAEYPVFSPDGESIVFVRNGKLQKLALESKSAVDLCDVFNVAGIFWMKDETIIFAQSGPKGGLYRIDATGGKPERFAAPDPAKGEQSYQHPFVTPNGKAVLFSIRPIGSFSLASSRIALRSLVSGEQKVLIEGAYYPRLSSSGHLLYIQGDRLMAVRFDSDEFKTEGNAIVRQEGILTKGDGVANFDVSNDGTFVYAPGAGGVAYVSRFIWKSRSGATIGPAIDDQLDYPRYPRISPDGREVAATIGAMNEGNIWIYDLNGARQPRKLTFKGHNTDATWSSDGTKVAFRSIRDGSKEDLYWIPSDGSVVEPELLLTTDYPKWPQAWSSDGKWLMFRTTNPQRRNIIDLWIIPVNGDRKPVLWSPTSFAETEASFSPNGRWVSYVSDQTGQPEVWARAFPGPGAPTRVSSAGGHDPVWSRAGTELFYQEGTKMMAAEVSAAQPGIRFRAPHMLFDGGFISFHTNTPRTYDVVADGRFLMIEQTASYSSQRLAVVLNWLEELKQRGPTK